MKKLVLLLIISFLSFGQDCFLPCNDPNACNYDPDFICDEFEWLTDCTVYCIYPAQYYDCEGCINDEDNDGICDELESIQILGCTDPNASNFNPEATNNDGSCIYEGCTDNNACNYDSFATVDNGFCEYNGDSCGISFLYYQEIEGGFVPTTVNTGIWSSNCDCINIYGCDDPEACNYYNSNNLPPTPLNVIYSSLDCNYPGEEFSVAIWPSTGATEIIYCPELSQECECCYRFSGEITTDGEMCEQYVCGCMDKDACNYDPDALLSNNSCVYDDGCINIQEIFNSKKLLIVLDLLGRETKNKGFQLHIYDDGSIDKKYVIE
tara:strand:- start:361 stop:1326 length:966 start_codon:yes stop_codon:yes gene_type:complete